MNAKVMLFLIAIVSSATAPAQQNHPGADAFTPTKIDWLTTTLQASLRMDLSSENKFLLTITSPDPETILIYVRYLPAVDRESMNVSIEAARKVIQITAKSYGWESWLKVKEDVQMADSRRK